MKGDTAGSSSGVIRLEVNNVSGLTSVGINSPKIEVLGMPWNLWVRKYDSNLGAYLCHRESDSNIWSFDVSVAFTLINVTESKRSFTQKLVKKFTDKIQNWGFPGFVKWSDVVNEDKGFIKDDKIIVEARFTISNVKGIRLTPLIDFTDSSDPCHDVALVINGKKVHANKSILSVNSPVFKSMFFGNFNERNKKEIELKEVDREEFIELLNFLYPSYQKITDSNAEYLLKLADRFEINTVIDKVEKFFIDSSTMSISAKLKFSDDYRLVKLQDHCLATFKTVKEITDLKGSADYEALSDTAKAALMDKAMKLG